MAAELDAALAARPRVLEGERGQFDVLVEGVVRYSKAETGRFPEPGEVVRLLQAGT